MASRRAGGREFLTVTAAFGSDLSRRSEGPPICRNPAVPCEWAEKGRTSHHSQRAGTELQPTVIERLHALEERIEALHRYYDELIAELMIEAAELDADESVP